MKRSRLDEFLSLYERLSDEQRKRADRFMLRWIFVNAIKHPSVVSISLAWGALPLLLPPWRDALLVALSLGFLVTFFYTFGR